MQNLKNYSHYGDSGCTVVLKTGMDSVRLHAGSRVWYITSGFIGHRYHVNSWHTVLTWCLRSIECGGQLVKSLLGLKSCWMFPVHKYTVPEENIDIFSASQWNFNYIISITIYFQLHFFHGRHRVGYLATVYSLSTIDNAECGLSNFGAFITSPHPPMPPYII